MQKLSKKEKKAVSKLLTQKLLSMNVADEIKYVASGKKKRLPAWDHEKNEVKVEDGKIVYEDIDVPTAMNPLRRTVRNLRNSSWEEIEAFLALEMPKEESLPAEQEVITEEGKNEQTAE